MPPLIQPVQMGAALVADIAAAQPEPGQIALWWLGQSGFCIKAASATVYIDLYLSEHLTTKYADTAKPHIRMTRAPLRGADLQDVAWVFATHKHSDHLDPGTLPDLLAANPTARLVLPQATRDHAVSLGLDPAHLIPTRGAETLTLDGLTVHAVPAAHPALDHDAANGYPFLGYVFELDGVTVYHSGDTLVYEGLADQLAPHTIDIALLPINGTSARLKALDVPPNMNIPEALDLAATIGARLLIPHHYAMFTFNTADVNEFIQAAEISGQPYHVLRCGERFVYTPA
ncbi:MAG: MBL fold metallo-hydrolase [Chloroflexi bacterium]|nr:MBL fold metallo-hydrolase [Chloroflexota bacterium]